MNRRDLIRRTTVFGAVAGISALTGCGQTARSSEAKLPKEKLAPLPAPPAGMLPAAFVLGKDAEVLDLCGPLEVFAGASSKDGKPLFAPYMVAATSTPVTVGGGMKVLPDYTFKTSPPPKLIVIPAMDMSGAPQEMYDWIRRASAATDVTMSVCNGAFVLAKTGLLAGKSATAHHGGFYRFAALHPDVHLKRGARFVEEGNIASAGGISSGIDLALRVVARYVGRDSTTELADSMEYQGRGWLNPDSNEAYATLPAFTEENPLCPVCLMRADRSIKTGYKGKNYYFCSSGEKEFFEQHTDVFDRFQAEDAARKRDATP